MRWEAVYKDGSVHTEEELKTSENVDRDQLKEFRLYEDKLIFVAHFNSNRRLIFRRRTTVKLNGEQKVVYLVGWHEKIRGESVKSICYIHDGLVEFDDARGNLELVKCENG